MKLLRVSLDNTMELKLVYQAASFFFIRNKFELARNYLTIADDEESLTSYAIAPIRANFLPNFNQLCYLDFWKGLGSKYICYETQVHVSHTVRNLN